MDLGSKFACFIFSRFLYIFGPHVICSSCTSLHSVKIHKISVSWQRIYHQLAIKYLAHCLLYLTNWGQHLSHGDPLSPRIFGCDWKTVIASPLFACDSYFWRRNTSWFWWGGGGTTNLELGTSILVATVSGLPTRKTGISHYTRILTVGQYQMGVQNRCPT